jgi:putative tryptophan/tyrosine transport system substrate-binding protein
MRRREFIAGAASATAFSIIARAQPMPLIGFLNSTWSERESGRVQAFREGLTEAGYVEGRNLRIDYRWAEGRNERLPELAHELVRRKVAVIVAGYNLASALAAKGATTTIPIVFQTGVDPIKAGLVSSLNRPTGNITGVTNLSNQVIPKYFEMLRELLPGSKTIALLVNPTNPAAESITKDAQEGALAVGAQLKVLRVSSERELHVAMGTLSQTGANALAISPDTMFASRMSEVGALALQQRIPTISPFRAYADAGVLLSYGGSVSEQGRQAGIYVGRILKGEAPANLPVLQVTKIELVINLRTAKSLGITIPPTLLARADEVIE